MLTILLAALVASCGFGVLVWKWKTGAASTVLAALPIALLLLVLPVPPVIYGMIRGFQRISASGSSGIVQVAGFCLDISRALFWGSVGFVVTMVAAGALQLLAARDEPEHTLDLSAPLPDHQPAKPSAGIVETVVLVGASLLVLPSAVLIHQAADTPRLIMSIAGQMTGPADPATRPPIVNAQEASQLISSRLVIAMLGGSFLSLLLLLAGAASLFVMRAPRPTRWVTIYSWAACVVCLALAIWNAVLLSADIQSFGRVLR